MDDYRELFKRELDRLSYLYAKANTKSKKKNMAYDLIFFEDMYNNLLDGENVVFPWSDDEVLLEVRDENTRKFVQNVLDVQQLLISIIENSFEIFLKNEFSIHGDYGKQYNKIQEVLLQKYIVQFYNQIDSNLKLRFRDKFDNLEIFVNNTIEKYAGLFFPVELVDKNIIFITTGTDMSLDEARILVHEMGHDFEFMNAKNSGVTSIWNGIVRTIYPEVSSSFFEYAFINYLIENNIYKNDALMLKRRYLNQVYYFLSYLLIIFSQSNLNIDAYFNIALDNEEVVKYANSLLEVMNSSDEEYHVGDKLGFRSSFVYGIGKLLAIYIYDSYKENPKEFLTNFKTALLEYKDTGIKAFNHLGITEEKLIDGDVLRRTLKDCK